MCSDSIGLCSPYSFMLHCQSYHREWCCCGHHVRHHLVCQAGVCDCDCDCGVDCGGDCLLQFNDWSLSWIFNRWCNDIVVFLVAFMYAASLCLLIHLPKSYVVMTLVMGIIINSVVIVSPSGVLMQLSFFFCLVLLIVVLITIYCSCSSCLFFMFFLCSSLCPFLLSSCYPLVGPNSCYNSITQLFYYIDAVSQSMVFPLLDACFQFSWLWLLLIVSSPSQVYANIFICNCDWVDCVVIVITNQSLIFSLPCNRYSASMGCLFCLTTLHHFAWFSIFIVMMLLLLFVQFQHHQVCVVFCFVFVCWL